MVLKQKLHAAAAKHVYSGKDSKRPKPSKLHKALKKTAKKDDIDR